MTDVYKIGVSIVLANGVSPVLAVIGRDLLGLDSTTRKIEGNFAGWSKALIGVGAILAGTTILGAMTKISEKAAEFTDSMIKLQTLNPGVAKLVETGEIQAKSFGLAKQLGMKADDVAKIYGGIYGVVQDPHHAEELLPYAARYARLQQMRDPKSRPEAHINTLVRAGELSGRLTDDKGAIDLKKVQEWFDLAAKLKAATHGQINEATLLALGQQAGGGALRGLSDDGYANMAIVSQMMGGHRAGTALLSLRQQMTGAMLSRNAEAMAKYGLLNPGEYRSDAGHTILTDSAKDRLLNLVNRDPMTFVNTIVDKMQAQGITDKTKQLQVLSEVLGRQTTQRMISDMLLAREQIARERKGLEQGMTVDQGLSLFQNKSVTANMQALSSAWDNLITALGGPNGANMISVLQTMTGVINRITDAVRGIDPNTLTSVYFAVAASAAALAAVVTFSLLGAPAILTALAVALGTLAALNWGSIKEFASTVEKIPVIGTGIMLMIRSIDMLVNIPWEKVVGVFNGIVGAVSGFIDQLLNIVGKAAWLFGFGSNKIDGMREDSLKKKSNFVPGEFNPGAREMPKQQLALSLNIDGRTLAQSVSDEIQAMYAFNTSAAAGSGVGRSPHSYSST